MAEKKSLGLDEIEVSKAPLTSGDFVICDADPTDPCLVICDADPTDPCL